MLNRKCMKGTDHCHNGLVQYLLGWAKENHKKITIVTSWAKTETWKEALTYPTSQKDYVYLRLFCTCSSSISSLNMLQISASVSK
jgi:predicted nucleic acid-binding Zn finger protein